MALRAKLAAGGQIPARAIASSDAAVLLRLLRDCANIVWTSCELLTGEDAERQQAFREVMAALAADNFAVLRRYSGAITFENYIALSTRDLLAQRLLNLLRERPDRFWTAFLRFFDRDLARLIRKRLPAESCADLRRDFHQEICLKLIEDDYRRLRSYSGIGSFAGFVARTVDRLLIDFLREIYSRRRLPAAVARLPALEQEIYRLIHWHGVPETPSAVTEALRARVTPLPDGAEIAAAMARIAASAPGNSGEPRMRAAPESGFDDDSAERWTDPAASPEESLILAQDEERLEQAVEVLKSAAAGMDEAERQYLAIALGGAEPPPAREIARIMGKPVEEIYKLKQRLLQRLREKISDEPAVKNWLASV